MKLTLGGIGLFGTNGALYPTLESNLRSLSPLTNLAGGGHSFNSKFTNKSKTKNSQITAKFFCKKEQTTSIFFNRKY